MNEIELLYEDIFCSEDGAKHRDELLEKYRDRLPELAKEHERSGMKVNGCAIPFIDVVWPMDRTRQLCTVDNNRDEFVIRLAPILKYLLCGIMLIILWRLCH